MKIYIFTNRVCVKKSLLNPAPERSKTTKATRVVDTCIHTNQIIRVIPKHFVEIPKTARYQLVSYWLKEDEILRNLTVAREKV